MITNRSAYRLYITKQNTLPEFLVDFSPFFSDHDFFKLGSSEHVHGGEDDSHEDDGGDGPERH